MTPSARTPPPSASASTASTPSPTANAATYATHAAANAATYATYATAYVKRDPVLLPPLPDPRFNTYYNVLCQQQRLLEVATAQWTSLFVENTRLRAEQLAGADRIRKLESHARAAGGRMRKKDTELHAAQCEIVRLLEKLHAMGHELQSMRMQAGMDR